MYCLSFSQDNHYLVLSSNTETIHVFKFDEDFEGQQEIYVKPVPELLTSVRLLAGLTVLGDGSPVFLLDLNHLV